MGRRVESFAASASRGGLGSTSATQLPATRPSGRRVCECPIARCGAIEASCVALRHGRVRPSRGEEGRVGWHRDRNGGGEGAGEGSIEPRQSSSALRGVGRWNREREAAQSGPRASAEQRRSQARSSRAHGKSLRVRIPHKRMSTCGSSDSIGHRPCGGPHRAQFEESQKGRDAKGAIGCPESRGGRPHTSGPDAWSTASSDEAPRDLRCAEWTI